jgi:hypothetical protein
MRGEIGKTAVMQWVCKKVSRRKGTASYRSTAVAAIRRNFCRWEMHSVYMMKSWILHMKRY